jgi:hypothetical protein
MVEGRCNLVGKRGLRCSDPLGARLLVLLLINEQQLPTKIQQRVGRIQIGDRRCSVRVFVRLRRDDVAAIAGLQLRRVHDVRCVPLWKSSCLFCLRSLDRLCSRNGATIWSCQAQGCGGSADVSCAFDDGDSMQVKPTVSHPSYGWGAVSHGDCGTVTWMTLGSVGVDFPAQSGWHGEEEELEPCGGCAGEDESGWTEYFFAFLLSVCAASLYLFFVFVSIVFASVAVDPDRPTRVIPHDWHHGRLCAWVLMVWVFNTAWIALARYKCTGNRVFDGAGWSTLWEPSLGPPDCSSVDEPASCVAEHNLRSSPGSYCKTVGEYELVRHANLKSPLFAPPPIRPY